jgi:lysophospholipase L1-like esterase
VTLARRAFALSLAALPLALLPAPAPAQRVGAPRTVLAATPISRMDLPRWRARHEAVLRRVREGHVGLIWLGDSITQDWERDGPQDWARFRPVWEHFYGDRDAVNAGFIGDTTASLLWRIENGEVDGISPRAAVILIGANNFGRVHWSAEDTVAGIEAIIAALHRKLPQTRLLLIGVLPSGRGAWVDASAAAANRMLAARYGRGGAVTYADLTSLFLRDGKLDPTQYLDPYLTPPDPPLHPTAQAQARMAAAIEPALASLMGDRDHTRAR